MPGRACQNVKAGVRQRRRAEEREVLTTEILNIWSVTCVLEASGESEPVGSEGLAHARANVHGFTPLPTNIQKRRGRRGSTTSAITQGASEVMLMLPPLDLGHLLLVSVIAA